MFRNMNSIKPKIPYGKTAIEFKLPSGMQGVTVTSKPAEPIEIVQDAIQNALIAPMGSPPLHQLASQGRRVCIVFTDITRASPDHLLVPALLAGLLENICL